MDAKDQARLAYQAWNETGQTSDPEAIKNYLAQLQRGLPLEDEFAALCVWSGRCSLIHKLSQEQFPTASRADVQVPDFFATFQIEGVEISTLIEVKSVDGARLRFSHAYHRRLLRYADSARLPLLVAWRASYGIWNLFDVREMTEGPGGGWHVGFQEAMKQTLMGVLLGEFHVTVRANVGMTIVMRRLEELTSTKFVGRVEAAYWHDGERNPVHDLAGNFMPLLLCCPEDVDLEDVDGLLTQSFYTPVENSVPAHWTMRTALLTEDDPNWLQLLREGHLSGGREMIRLAAIDGIDKGMVSYVMDIEPNVRPDFLPPRLAQPSTLS